MTSTVFTQFQIEENKLASMGAELQQTAQWMMAAAGTPEFSQRQDVYYPKLNTWRTQKQLVNSLRTQVANQPHDHNTEPRTQAANALEEKRAIKEATVTSSTYQRAQKRLMKQVNGILSGRRH